MIKLQTTGKNMSKTGLPSHTRNHNRSRRRFLGGVLATGGAGIISLLAPLRALANWPEKLFGMTEYDKTIATLTQGAPTHELPMLTAPKIAENGAQVRVSINIPADKLKEIKKISLVVEKNPVPLTSQFITCDCSAPSIAINLKVRETSRIVALAEADGKIYKDEDEVQVAAGGCG